MPLTQRSKVEVTIEKLVMGLAHGTFKYGSSRVLADDIVKFVEKGLAGEIEIPVAKPWEALNKEFNALECYPPIRESDNSE